MHTVPLKRYARKQFQYTNFCPDCGLPLTQSEWCECEEPDFPTLHDSDYIGPRMPCRKCKKKENPKALQQIEPLKQRGENYQGRWYDGYDMAKKINEIVNFLNKEK